MSQPHEGRVPKPPEKLPARRRRRFRSHDDVEFSVALKVVTPILGGSFFTGGESIDYVRLGLDTIRVPTIRGHLRFWWRALQPSSLDAAGLRAKESALWGGMGGDEGGKRAAKPQASQVNVRVEAIELPNPDLDPSPPQQQRGSGYAMFSARQENGIVPRLKPGVIFTLRVTVPEGELDAVRQAVRAWILFGGYGSRTRRGLGSLTVASDADAWLPASATADDLQALLAGTASTTDTPSLAGASLVVGQAVGQAETAWDQAVGQLQFFRQQPPVARNQGANRNRPGQSLWPEPDKIRHLTRRTQGHQPRFRQSPAWPRAQFGLPIVGKFNGGNAEPGPFSIQWVADGETKPADRLASPLIVKALPLADGRFVPCALWLARGYPRGKVVLVMNNQVVPRSEAAFETMHGDGDNVLHSALRGKTSVRQAFLDWLVSECRWQRVRT